MNGACKASVPHLVSSDEMVFINGTDTKKENTLM